MVLLLSTGPIAYRLMHAVEVDAPVSYQANVTYDAVVLLGGAVDHGGLTEGQPAYGDGVERLLATFELLRTDHARAAIVSGRSGYDGAEPANVNETPGFSI